MTPAHAWLSENSIPTSTNAPSRAVIARRFVVIMAFACLMWAATWEVFYGSWVFNSNTEFLEFRGLVKILAVPAAAFPFFLLLEWVVGPLFDYRRYRWPLHVTIRPNRIEYARLDTAQGDMRGIIDCEGDKAFTVGRELVGEPDNLQMALRDVFRQSGCRIRPHVELEVHPIPGVAITPAMRVALERGLNALSPWSVNYRIRQDKGAHEHE